MMLLNEDISAGKKALKQAKANKPAYQNPARHLPSPTEMEYGEEGDIVNLTDEAFMVFRSSQQNEQQAQR